MESVSRISWRKRRVQLSVTNPAVRNSLSPPETKALQGCDLDVRTRLSKELPLQRASNSGMTEISIWELGISRSKFITVLASLWGFKLVKFTYIIIIFTFPQKKGRRFLHINFWGYRYWPYVFINKIFVVSNLIYQCGLKHNVNYSLTLIFNYFTLGGSNKWTV